MKKIFLILPLLFGSYSCISTGNGTGLETLETMSDQDFARLKLYSSLGVKISAQRLVTSGKASEEDLNAAADVLEGLKTNPVVTGVDAIVQQLLDDSGLTSAEIRALIEIVVFELNAAGVFNDLNPNGTLKLGPRTEELIDLLIASMRFATSDAIQFVDDQCLLK